MNDAPSVGHPHAQSLQAGPARPGQMTAVMRAMARATGPKVLRVGLVQGGRVVEERALKERTSVTIGASEKATFVVPSELLPAQFELFQLVGSDYHLNFLDGMTGRVALTSGVSDLATLAGQARRVGLGHQVKLTDEARGKIHVGASTILFQFVAPPPAQSQPRLPLAVKANLVVDWSLTVIAAFSFLVHFGAIGALYSDWTDPIVDTGADVRGLVDMLPAAPPVTVEDQAPPEDTKTADVTKKETSDRPAPAKPSTTTAPAPKPSMNDRDAHLLAQRAEAIGIGILASFEGKSAVESALNRSVLPGVDMTKAAESSAAVDASPSDLHMTTTGLVAANKKGLGDIVGGVGTGAKSTAGPVAVVPGPSGKADLGPIVPSAPVRGLDRTVAELRPKFRRCYESKGLAVDSSMAGDVTMVVKISPNGEVKSADPGAINGLSQPVVSCIARVLKDASFDAPGSSGSVVQIPVKFVRQ